MGKELHYGHDIWGAKIRGYSRRAKDAARKLVTNCDGWRNPSNPKENPGHGLGLALGEVVKVALDLGLDQEYTINTIKRFASDHNIEQVVRRSERDKATMEWQLQREDPAAGFAFEDVERHIKDYSYRKTLDPERLLGHLRDEFNLRRQAQIERDDLLRELGRL